jgi:uncharacterized OB-fold protein
VIANKAAPPPPVPPGWPGPRNRTLPPLPPAPPLYSYTVAYRPVAPHFADTVPHVVAVAQWDEGPRFATEIVNAEPSELQVGMRIRPVFVDFPDDDITLLHYEPA